MAPLSPKENAPPGGRALKKEKENYNPTVLSDSQLADLYSSCIKLSTENKINVKNTWELNLIDYMGTLVDGDGDDTNFAKASCTIDASVKIYAYRVDSVHNRAFRVLGGLSRTEQRPDGEEGDEGEGEDENGNEEKEEGEEGGDNPDDAAAKKKKPKKTSGPCVTLEANMSALNIKKFELEFAVDPLFQKTSAAFDEGGARGLLLNHLSVYNGVGLIFDSNDAIAGNSAVEYPPDRPCDVTALKALLSADFNELEICPAFTNFIHEQWARAPAVAATAAPAIPASLANVSIDGSDNGSDGGLDVDADVLFGAGAAFNPLGAFEAAAEADDGAVFGGDPLDFDDDGSNAPARTTRVSGASANGDVLVARAGPTNTEFAYFDMTKLRNWAGPEHWRFQAKPKAKEEGPKKERKKRAAFSLDFATLEPVDVATAFKKSRAATTLSKAARAKLTAQANLLPKDIHYDPKELTRLALRPKFHVFHARSVPAGKRGGDDGADVPVGDGWYNYDNANDVENFCPAAPADEFDDDDGDLGDPLTASLPHDEAANNTTTFDGKAGTAAHSGPTQLVAEPRKVAKIEINYAKVAKKVDVKALKEGIWTELVDKKSTTTPRINETQDFKGLVTRLPAALPKAVMTDVSVPFCFICLLHLANEQNLSLEGREDLSNIVITQAPAPAKAR